VALAVVVLDPARVVVVVVGAGALVVLVVDGTGAVVVVDSTGAVVVVDSGGAVVVVDSAGAVVVVDTVEGEVPAVRAAEAVEAPAMRIELPPRKERTLTAASPWRMRFRLMPGDSAPHLGELCEFYLSFRRVVGDRPFCRI
jgi:hypothetical protein